MASGYAASSPKQKSAQRFCQGRNRKPGLAPSMGMGVGRHMNYGEIEIRHQSQPFFPDALSARAAIELVIRFFKRALRPAARRWFLPMRQRLPDAPAFRSKDVRPILGRLDPAPDTCLLESIQQFAATIPVASAYGSVHGGSSDCASPPRPMTEDRAIRSTR
jgi:hypothetical protein